MIVDVAGAVPRFPRRDIEAFVRRALRAIERAGGASFSPTEVSIAFLGDAAMTELNRRWRAKRKTTDVLTFPAESAPGATAPLGDIVISIDQAKRQARAEGHSLATEVRYLLLHGLLHAFGWDHETDSGEMNALELALRGRLGLR
ncbi:MAG: rRNA maturation RNase YbeY [Thermoanaerobaculia bacterium]